MISAQHAISRFQRDMTFGTLLRAALVAAAVLCLLLRPFLPEQFDRVLLWALVAVGVAWFILSYRSIRGSRLAAASPFLIATGRLDEAERHIEQSLRTFSLFRTSKLLGLHHLAMLRHAQRRWHETAMLCRTFLKQRLGALQVLSRPSRLILAESLLEIGDLRGAHEAMMGLYQQKLSLGEALHLLRIQVDYLARIGAWEQLVQQLPAKVQLAELMSSAQAARTQAMLALAARKTGRDEWAQWLRRRAELLADVQQLAQERPVLWELWSAA